MVWLMGQSGRGRALSPLGASPFRPFPGKTPDVSQLDEEWAERIRALGPEPSDEDLAAFLGDAVHQATSPGRAAVAAYLRSGGDEVGRRLLSGLDFAGLLGGLYAPPAETPTARAWLLGHLVEAELHLRGRLGARLREALFDRGEVEEPPVLVPAERRAPRRRVCDEAYILLRSLFHPEEDAVGFIVERDAYLALSDEERDRRIQEALIQGRWNLAPFDLPGADAP